MTVAWSIEGFRAWLQGFAEFHGMSEEEMLACLLTDPGQGMIHSHRKGPSTAEELRPWSEGVEALPDGLLADMCEVHRQHTGYYQSVESLRNRMRRLMREAAEDLGGTGSPYTARGEARRYSMGEWLARLERADAERDAIKCLCGHVGAEHGGSFPLGLPNCRHRGCHCLEFRD